MTKKITDKEGRFLLLTIELPNLCCISLINVYGPNTDDAAWLTSVINKIDDSLEENQIWMGDWNTPLEIIDIYNYQSIRHKHFNDVVKKMMRSKDLLDIWRVQNPDTRRFTWGSKKPYKRSRLDYCLISQGLMGLCPKADIKPSYKSDHSPIEITLNITKQPRGKSQWKFNNKLLENNDYLEMVRNEINLAKATYALPVYNSNYVENNLGTNLELNISDSLFLDTILCQIRGETIKFSKKIAREKRAYENKLVENISSIEKSIDANEDAGIKETLSQYLESKKDELEKWRDDKLCGAMIRSRAALNSQWEKPSSFFLNLEKKNYLNKSIPELIDDDGEIHTDLAKIMAMQHSFYSNLFSSKPTIPITDSKYGTLLTNLPKITRQQEDELDRDITIDELEAAIKSSKLNKAPGPDGYSNEFFKTFSHELLHWIFRAYNDAISKNTLTETTKKGLITCIPKQGKDRNILKNWRPLTMLNCTYKFFSSILADRLKATLTTVINPDQTGFISNRFIGDNTRLLYDTINHCEMEHKEGLIIVLDFAKAFDTIEWSYIYSCMQLFGYGERFISFIKLLHQGSTSVIENNGHLSKQIELSRGCRQGDPISPYIFVLCAEILSHCIRECEDVRGLEIYGTEIAVSQYADDTTLFLEGSLDVIKRLMSILGWFKKISGLAINVDKTKAVKIGALRDRSLPWEGRYGMDWTDNFTVLGINYNVNKMGDITSLNMESKINDIKKMIRLWQARKLSPYGKVTVIKSLFLSKITHLLLSLPSPNQKLFNEIDKLFSNFLWSNKPPKFRKNIIESDIMDGGLRLHNLKKFDLALKLGWAKRLLTSKSKWTIFPNFWEIYDTFTFGPDRMDRIKEVIYNPFWADFIKSVDALFKTDIILHRDIIHELPLWFNPLLKINFKMSWYDKGIRKINDLVDTYGRPMELTQFQNTFKIKSNFLEFGKVCILLKKFLRFKEFPENSSPLPSNSYLNIIVNMDKKGVSNLYKTLNGRHFEHVEEACDKWNLKGNLSLTPIEISKSFKRHSTLVDDTYAKYIQFRTLHQRFFTNDRLHKIGIKDNSLCSMCKAEPDSNPHMILKCQKSKKLWTEVERWINHLGFVDYILTENSIVTGDINKSRLLSIIILFAKITIYNARMKEKTPNFFNFINLLKNQYIQSKYIANITNKIDEFEREWHLLIIEFE